MKKSLQGTPLKRFHREFRREHPIQHSLAVILQSVEYPVNVGSAFRIADAVRVEEMILTGITPVPPNPTIVKVGRNKHTRVPWRYEKETEKPISELKAQAYRIYALEIAGEAQPYYEVDWPEKVCLVVGHEDHGVTKVTMALCDETVFIPMWGKGASLNVHVALAVVLFHIRYLGIQGGKREETGSA
ncbi:MAG: TrmH family RNA methyltransferase [Chloroflexi bacterium]|nr:TrmH family RNA methyltransferase [Chloroflexota bacterium]